MKATRFTLAGILLFLSLIIPSGVLADGCPMPMCPTQQSCRGFVDATLQH
jgi:hypothetical protein